MDIEQRKKILIDELRTLGVAKLVIEYSGSGDSGAVDCISAYSAADLVEMDKPGVFVAPKDVDEMAEAYYGRDGQIAIRVSNKLLGEDDALLSLQLEKFAYDLLDYFAVGDWVNNDGGSGKLTFYVDGDEHGDGDMPYPPGHIVCDHEQYETVSHSETHEL